MIYLITGQPGAGKTARAVERMLQFVAEGRDVYAAGIRGLDYAKAGVKPLEDPSRWQDLPDGSVVVLDECYEHFPKRAAGAKVPPHVQALATHRHRGFDFIMIAQMGRTQLDDFVRGLIHQHEHVVEKGGTKMCRIRTWPRFEGDPEKATCDDNKVWVRPKRVFELYESTVLDTKRRSVPMVVIYLALGISLVAAAAWYIMHRWDARAAAYDTHQQAAEGDTRPERGAASSAFFGSSGPSSLRQTDYAAWLTPRVPGKPWTAPAYDSFQPQHVPMVYCISSEVTCNCVTEQGTTYQLEEELCRMIARHGNYNPLRQPQPVHEPVMPSFAPSAPDAAPVASSHSGNPRIGTDYEPWQPTASHR